MRLTEAEASEDVRKFLYVKITFNTPTSYQPSLGKKFYVKRQWTVSRGQDYHEEMSSSIPSNRKHIATRLINKIAFIYVPAIKDYSIFEMLLSGIHETVAQAPAFETAVDDFAIELQALTNAMFDTLPEEVSASTKIGAPTRLSQLFQSLDFETTISGEIRPKSLTRQRGDGIKARHIPELLNFISEKDKYDYHIWGFEEPENSLDFVAAQSEALRLLSLAKSERVQVYITTHSPSFYLLKDASASKFYVRKGEDGLSTPTQGRDLDNFDAQQAVGEGFYLPAVAKALEEVASIQAKAKEAESNLEVLRAELEDIARPVVLTEGRTDAEILTVAWSKRRGDEPPFAIRSCETGGEKSGSGDGGAGRLAIRLKGVAGNHPNAVIGLFDYDKEGTDAFKLDRNFVKMDLDGHEAKRGMHGQSYAACLPAPDFRKQCKEYCNLPIEFLFRDEHLATEVEGQRLTLKRKKASTMVGQKKIEMELDDFTHFKDVGAGKSEFASTVVPTLEPAAFDAFDAVFDMIEAIIAHNQNDG